MRFKVIKSSFDGICGGDSRYESIAEVLAEISYSAGWDSKEQLHDSIRRWANVAVPGSVFATRASVVVCVGPGSNCRAEDECHECGHQGLSYDSELEPTEDGNIEQKVSCPECGWHWLDIFVLAEQKRLRKKPPE
jgi:DNA-directed RNA polymerase subunit M/transcription elongation factor TFIIS